MRKATLFSLVLIAMLGCRTNSSQRISYVGLLAEIRAPQKLEFGGETYEVEYSAVGDKWANVEYYRNGESRKSWKHKLALRIDADSLSSLQQVKRIERSINDQIYGASVVYESPNGHSVEFSLISPPDRHEFDVSRYWDRTNGTISLHFSQIIPSAEIHKPGREKGSVFYGRIRSNMVDAMAAMNLPDIEAPLPPRQ